jgi:hypothetical protein
MREEEIPSCTASRPSPPVTPGTLPKPNGPLTPQRLRTPWRAPRGPSASRPLRTPPRRLRAPNPRRPTATDLGPPPSSRRPPIHPRRATLRRHGRRHRRADVAQRQSSAATRTTVRGRGRSNVPLHNTLKDRFPQRCLSTAMRHRHQRHREAARADARGPRDGRPARELCCSARDCSTERCGPPAKCL